MNRCFLATVAAAAGLMIAAQVARGDAEARSSAFDLSATETPQKYDIAPVVKRKAVPVYPYDMLLAGKSGWAEASFVVDYLGRPLFAAPKEASDPAFAKSLVAMVEASDYAPGKRGKHAVMSPLTEHYQFSGEASLDSGERRVLAALRSGSRSFTQAAELDERPRALRQESPVYPRALKDDGLTGEAEIEFVVDRDGRVLFPHVVSATHEDFGWAAATAVAQWHYKSPVCNGKHVDTIMRVPVLFDAHKLAAAD